MFCALLSRLKPPTCLERGLLERDGPPFDHIVIELSGVADPTNVQSSLGLGDIAVDRKVALVDAQSSAVDALALRYYAKVNY